MREGASLCSKKSCEYPYPLVIVRVLPSRSSTVTHNTFRPINKYIFVHFFEKIHDYNPVFGALDQNLVSCSFS